MTDLVITPADVRPVRVIDQLTGPCDEAVVEGQAVRLATATGRFTKANGSSAAEARVRGIAVSEATQAGDAITVITEGIVDVGDALDALTYDDDVFLSDTDGTLADAAGTVGVYVGTVVPGWGTSTPDKLLHVKPRYVDLIE